MAKHEFLADGANHRVTNFTWANATARTTQVYAATDLYKEGVQTDTTPPTFWRIDSVDGAGSATFQPMGSAAPLTGSTLNSLTLNNPTSTGIHTVPTAADGTNTTQAASTAFVQNAITALKDGVSTTYDTLAKIATALGDKLDASAALFFKTISISGQSDVVADSAADTLTLVAGTNVSITTDPATDTITFSAIPSAGGETTASIGALISGAAEKTTPVDADMFALMDSAASNVMKKLSWANLKAALKTYFDTLYISGTGIYSFNNRSASYTLVIGDQDTLAVPRIVTIANASANTLTVPPNSSVAFPVGAKINFIQAGAGQTTITAGAGVTLQGTPGLKCRAQFSPVTLIKSATNTWYVIGDLSA